jgi:hypothetical protein
MVVRIHATAHSSGLGKRPKLMFLQQELLVSAIGILASLVAAWALHGSAMALFGYGLAAITIFSNGILFNFSVAEIQADIAPPWAIILGPLSGFVSIAVAVVSVIMRS